MPSLECSRANPKACGQYECHLNEYWHDSVNKQAVYIDFLLHMLDCWVPVIPLSYVPYLRETPGDGKKQILFILGRISYWAGDTKDHFHPYISLDFPWFPVVVPGPLGISAIVKVVEHLAACFVPFTGRRMWQIHLLHQRLSMEFLQYGVWGHPGEHQNNSWQMHLHPPGI